MKKLDPLEVITKQFGGVWEPSDNEGFKCDDGRRITRTRDNRICLHSNGLHHYFSWHQLGVE